MRSVPSRVDLSDLMKEGPVVPSVDVTSAPSESAPVADPVASTSIDPAAAPPEGDAASPDATPSWDGLLRNSGLSTDRMRLGWLVAFAMVVTLALAICGGREERAGLPRADGGRAIDGNGAVVQG
jgi:hypothetical protein